MRGLRYLTLRNFLLVGGWILLALLVIIAIIYAGRYALMYSPFQTPIFEVIIWCSSIGFVAGSLCCLLLSRVVRALDANTDL